MTGTRPAGRRNAGAPPAAPLAGTGTRPPGRPKAAPWEAPGWRRGLQLALAALWLLDAVLQYQTFMFSQGFPRMLAATSGGNPASVAGPVTWGAHLIGTHPGAANAAFATLQLLLALGIAWRPTTRAGRARWRARATAGPRAAVSRGQHGTHVLSCSAMVCMLLAGPAAGARMGAGPGAGLLPVAALLLAVAVSVSVVVSTDRLPALRPAPIPVATALAHAGPPLAQTGPAPVPTGPVPTGPAPGSTGQAAGTGATPAPAGPRSVLCLRLAACCQIMMGVAMAYMLILML